MNHLGDKTDWRFDGRYLVLNADKLREIWDSSEKIIQISDLAIQFTLLRVRTMDNIYWIYIMDKYCQVIVGEENSLFQRPCFCAVLGAFFYFRRIMAPLAIAEGLSCALLTKGKHKTILFGEVVEAVVEEDKQLLNSLMEQIHNDILH